MTSYIVEHMDLAPEVIGAQLSDEPELRARQIRLLGAYTDRHAARRLVAAAEKYLAAAERRGDPQWIAQARDELADYRVCLARAERAVETAQ